MQRLSEATLLALVILAPWAYGCVEAWAELGLYAGILLITILNFGSLRDARGWARLLGAPSLALGALTLLAVFQATSLSPVALNRLMPSAAARSGLLPAQPERVQGDDGASVPLPAGTLSLDPDVTLQTAARLAAAWLLFQGVSGLGASGRVRLARLVTANAALLALFAVVQSLTWNGSIYWVRPAPEATRWSVGGPFMSHNHLAAYLNMGLGLALGLLLSDRPRDWLRRGSPNVGMAYAAAIIVAGIVACHSRSGFLGLLAGGLVLIPGSRKRPAAFWIGLVIVLLTAGLYLAILAPSSSFGARLATILDLGDEGYRSRLEAWRAAIAAWWARPIWGSGLGSFPIAVSAYLRRDRPVFFARAENEYLDLLAEGGALGFSLGVAFVAAIGCLAYRAIRRPSGLCESDGGFVRGALFGLVALLFQSLADFGPHVPAIGVLAIALCGQLAMLAQASGSDAASPTGRREGVGSREGNPRGRGLRDRPPVRAMSAADVPAPSPSTGSGRLWHLGPTLAWLGSLLLAGVLLANGVRNARVESRLVAVGLPVPGTYLPTVGTDQGPSWDLEAWREALTAALQLRPGWAEGHLRLGLVHLELYRLSAREWLLDAGTDPDESESMADPLWLLGAVHAGRPATAGPPPDAEVVRFEPVRRHLVPAARSFLEARRCCPYWALPHAQLATLDYLLVGGDPAPVYADRALRLAGNDSSMMMFLARVALEVKDPGLATQCWRRSLAADPSSWPQIADSVATVLTPTQILSEVVQDGRGAIEFAHHLYPGPEQRDVRERFLQAAFERLDHDPGLTDAERFYLQARALAGLGRPGPARRRMEAALTLRPGQSTWREMYIDWLLQWGLPDEAHAQALTGLALSPNSSTLRTAVERTAEAVARSVPEN
ncbi:MAG: O-antigen ligase family protein [Isosphaeraceae bacterium]